LFMTTLDKGLKPLALDELANRLIEIFYSSD
jgi:hypothetical protein